MICLICYRNRPFACTYTITNLSVRWLSDCPRPLLSMSAWGTTLNAGAATTMEAVLNLKMVKMMVVVLGGRKGGGGGGDGNGGDGS